MATVVPSPHVRGCARVDKGVLEESESRIMSLSKVFWWLVLWTLGCLPLQGKFFFFRPSFLYFKSTLRLFLPRSLLKTEQFYVGFVLLALNNIHKLYEKFVGHYVVVYVLICLLNIVI